MIPALAILVSGTLYFTLPNRESAGLCGVGEAPCSDLATAHLYRQARGAPARLIKSHSVVGREGQLDSFTFDAGDSVVGYYVTTRDHDGNESCASPIYQANGSVSVPPARPVPPPRAGRFDAMGRRMSSRAPGWYWHPDSLRMRLLR